MPLQKKSLKYALMGSEHKEQCKIFTWALEMSRVHPALGLLNGSLNGVRLNIGQAVKAKKAGMVKGWPDINLPVARGGYIGMYIELKVKRNKPDDDQVRIMQALAAEDHYCCAAWGARAAQDEIIRYLEGEVTKSEWLK